MKREEARGQRIGAMKGKLALPDDFDAPPLDELLDAFEGLLPPLPSFALKDEKHPIEKQIQDPTIKRDIFSELMDGLEALADERQGKITLRTHKVQLPELVPITAEEVVAIRQQLNLSRSVFAMYLRTNTRTLENWEQGRAVPNAQATTLIRLVERFPQTIEQLAALT